jgi:hypothetical protein
VLSKYGRKHFERNWAEEFCGVVEMKSGIKGILTRIKDRERHVVVLSSRHVRLTTAVLFQIPNLNRLCAIPQ